MKEKWDDLKRKYSKYDRKDIDHFNVVKGIFEFIL